MLFHLQESLKAVVLDEVQNEEDVDDDESTSDETPAVIRIAAHAAVLLIDKYMDLTWDCEIYVISMGAFQFLTFLYNLIVNISTSYVSRSEAPVAEKLYYNRTNKGDQEVGN